MADISVIILVGREELHIRRCLERLAPMEPRQVFVVESQKGDRTHEIAIEAARQLQWQVKVRGEGEQWNGLGSPVDVTVSSVGAGSCPRPQQDQSSTIDLLSRPTLSLVWHDWPGLYAQQFNWALDYVEGRMKKEEGRCEDGWILRLDADEYLTPDTIEKLKQFLCSPSTFTFSDNVAGLTLELRRRFCGGEIRHATNGIRLLRLWRCGRGRSEERSMDEHIAIDGISDLDELRRQGKVVDFDGAFYDDNLNDMDWWRAKHRGYAKREAADALAFYRGEIRFKPMKERYYRLPPYLRAFAYFCIRYFQKGGFLDGRAGWMWNFWQGLWYRCLVDREISRIKSRE